MNIAPEIEQIDVVRRAPSACDEWRLILSIGIGWLSWIALVLVNPLNRDYLTSVIMPNDTVNFSALFPYTLMALGVGVVVNLLVLSWFRRYGGVDARDTELRRILQELERRIDRTYGVQVSTSNLVEAIESPNESIRFDHFNLTGDEPRSLVLQVDREKGRLAILESGSPLLESVEQLTPGDSLISNSTQNS